MAEPSGPHEHKVWFGGLNWNTVEDDLKRAIRDAMGPDASARPSSIKVIFDMETRKSKGFAFVGCVGTEQQRTSSWFAIASVWPGLDAFPALVDA
jgi:RNA recognition motif-containing protein